MGEPFDTGDATPLIFDLEHASQQAQEEVAKAINAVAQEARLQVSTAFREAQRKAHLRFCVLNDLLGGLQ